MKPNEYQGKEIVITYDAERCIHVKECIRGAPSTFSASAQPWVTPDGTDAKTLAAVIRKCPSGALHYQPTEKSLTETPGITNSVSVQPDGPLYVRGNISLRDGDSTLHDTRMALCRCGASARKPFCDNSHFAVTFLDPAITPPGPDAHTEMATTSKLMIDPTHDGPLHLQGQITIRNSYDQVIFEGVETWLCRCGHSGNKPFCDGSHERAGFKAE